MCFKFASVPATSVARGIMFFGLSVCQSVLLSVCPSIHLITNALWEFPQIWYKCSLGLKNELDFDGQRSKVSVMVNVALWCPVLLKMISQINIAVIFLQTRYKGAL